ncbi:hypothetical protein TorRG33x02_175010 [Trema orientale]|uniref:Uncharacterized protein n=1 Tax=Trema orientale TaxID=63057 RepID=A0A2P5EMD5_TREOI|nr:hypothetical protein TorRG33x02_175010 [Trema orientale]
MITTRGVTGRHVSPPLWNTLRVEGYLLVSATRYFSVDLGDDARVLTHLLGPTDSHSNPTWNFLGHNGS